VRIFSPLLADLGRFDPRLQPAPLSRNSARRSGAKLRRLGALLGALCVFQSAVAHATIVERVVAVVGERPILLSELRSRAKPFEQTLPPAGGERATAVTQLYAQMLDRIVDEELIEKAAVQAQLKVSGEEVDAAIGRVAKGNNVEVEQLLTEVERGGVTRAQYRIEIRRQLLDAKLMNLRLQGRLRISEEDLKREYNSIVRTERQQLEFRVVQIRIAAGKTSAERQAVIKFGAGLVERARAGEDFAELSRTYSTDAAVKATGGEMPKMQIEGLPKELRGAVLGLEVGEVSGAIRSGQDLVILKLVERTESALPSFQEAAENIAQRVQLQKMERARRAWLDGLRRRTHVEVRL
jgi:peptidyl-prolyl cis-trans isomerase SurA